MVFFFPVTFVAVTCQRLQEMYPAPPVVGNTLWLMRLPEQQSTLRWVLNTYPDSRVVYWSVNKISFCQSIRVQQELFASLAPIQRAWFPTVFFASTEHLALLLDCLVSKVAKVKPRQPISTLRHSTNVKNRPPRRQAQSVV